MKKILISVLFISLAITSKVCLAQENKKITLGVKIGANLSKFSSEVGDYSNANPYYYNWENCFREGGPVVGGFANFKIFKPVSLQAEFLYNSRGGRSRKPNGQVDVVTTNTSTGTSTTSSAYNFRVFRVNYFEVPLLVNIDVSHGKGFCIQGGVAASFLLSSNLRENYFNINRNDESVKEKWHVSDFPYANRNNTSFILGLAFIKEHGYIDLRYTKSLQDTYNFKNTVNPGNTKLTMTTFSFSIGGYF